MTAARYANLSAVKLLVRYGADVDMKSRWGRTALDDARKYNKQPRIMDKRDVVAFLEDKPFSLLQSALRLLVVLPSSFVLS